MEAIDQSERNAVIGKIRDAFQFVVLGKGIGLLEGQGHDGGAEEAVILSYRTQDEKMHWDTIPTDQLNACHSSLSFFDPEGMRFHLPAYLIADLKEQLGVDPVFHLTHLDDYARGKLVLLSAEQPAAVRAYLLFVRDEPNYEFDREAIDLALENYWCDDIQLPPKPTVIDRSYN